MKLKQLVLLESSSLRLIQVVEGLELGRAALLKIRQNLAWALAYNVVGIPLAAGMVVGIGIKGRGGVSMLDLRWGVCRRTSIDYMPPCPSFPFQLIRL